MNSLQHKDHHICLLCGQHKALPIDDTHLEAGITYTLNECESCNVQFWLPLKNPGATWYEHDTRYADRNENPILKPNKKHIDVLRAFKGSPGRLLDIGCGVGNFLVFAKAKGWQAWGIDFDKDAIKAAQTRLGLENVSAAHLREFKTLHPDLRFDLITFFDVLEHLDDHHTFIADVLSLIAPHGSVAFSVPYRHGWRWLLPSDLPPRHLTRWDDTSLEKFFSRNGFVRSYTNRLPASLYYITLKLKFRYGGWSSVGIVSKAMKQDIPVSTQVGVPGKPSKKVRLLQAGAKIKDFILFGIPATIIWIALLFTRARYTDIYAIYTLADSSNA